MKLIFRILASILGVLFVVLLGGYLWLSSSLPMVSGELEVPNLEASVTISRTENGVPIILADNDLDALRALGFVHAQDRLWQMESMRRFALGTLSEAAGETTLNIDERQRRLGLEALAKAQYSKVLPEVRDALDAYAEGVNAYLETRSGSLPLEFIALNHDPNAWEPWHGLLWGRLMGYQLSNRWRQDIARQSLLEKWGPDRLRALWPEMDVPEVDLRPSSSSLEAPHYETPMGASNAWAVAPNRSSSGAALLAGDPHLGLRIPGTWYLVRIQVGERFVEGASSPGTPIMVLGRNNDVAWSITSNEADLQDLRRVTLDDVTKRQERLYLKDGQFKTIDLYSYGDAPIVAGGLLDGSSDVGYALHSTALTENDLTPNALYGLNIATSVAEGIEALKDYNAPFMNVHLADRSGVIARVHVGSLPKRPRGADGRFPRATDGPPWLTVPIHTVTKPDFGASTGTVGNANERTDALDNVGFPVPGDWPAKTRGARLETLLAAKSTYTVEDMIQMQADTVDVAFFAWRPILEAMGVVDQAQEAKDILLSWDGRMDRNLAAPLIFAAWMAEIEADLFLDVEDADVGRLLLPGPLELAQMIANESGWCSVRNCLASARLSFDRTIRALKQTYGFDLEDWRWGDAHVAPFEHNLLSRLPGLSGLFSRPIETDGGNRTLHRGGSRGGSATTPFRHIHGAGFRAIHDMSSDFSYYMLVPGQSGNPMSAHYDSLLERWRDVDFIRFDAPIEDVLTLRPQ